MRTRLPLAAELALALVPGALTLYLAFESGGYFPASTALAAAELCLLAGVVFVVARRPFGGIGLPLAVAVAALGGLALWTLASSTWSDAPGRALVEHHRTLLYVAALVAFGALPYSPRRVRWMVYGIAGAIVVVAAAAFAARVVPGSQPLPEVHPERLAHPLGYWNALGILAGIGIVLCGHLSSDARGHAVARVLGAGAVPLLAVVLYYTFSRGATWASLVAVALYVILGRPRGLASAALATVPTTAIALMAANPPGALTGSDPLGAAAAAAGNRVALSVAACVAAAMLLRTLALPLDRAALGVVVAPRHRALLVRSAALVAVAAAGIGAIAVNLPGVVEAKADEFSSANVGGAGGSSRLFQLGNNGRVSHWEVALDAYRDDPLHGSGAGTYPIEWARTRDGSVSVRDAHSLYLETLGELGLPGLALLAAALLATLGAFAVRARGRDRPLFAALLAAGVAWALHAAVDWDWELPAVTLWLFALGGAALARGGRRTLAAPPWALTGMRAVAVAACVAVALGPARLAVADARLEDSIEGLSSNDCRAAAHDARAALDMVAERPEPHHVIAFCALGERRYAVARRSYRRALERDPDNWEYHLGLAVARAGDGLDPRPHARQARALNPNEPIAQEAAALRGSKPRAWRRAAAGAEVTPP